MTYIIDTIPFGLTLENVTEYEIHGIDANEEAKKFLEIQIQSNPKFGNARGVRNFFEKIIKEQARRLSGNPNADEKQLRELSVEDVKSASGR